MVRTGLEGIPAKTTIDASQQLLHQKDDNHYINSNQMMITGFLKFDTC